MRKSPQYSKSSPNSHRRASTLPAGKFISSLTTSLCFFALPLLLVFLSLDAKAVVEPDTTSKKTAIEMAKASNKMILLIVSDTNRCSGCIVLEFTSLPSTVPPIRQMVEESFVHWACGGEIASCNDYTTYTGVDTFPLPAYFVIDPTEPNVYRSSGFGGGDPVTFFNFLTRGLLKATSPWITNVVDGVQSLAVQGGSATDLVVHGSDILVQGRSVSTNVTLRKLRYSLNEGPWTYFTITNHLSWELPLHLNPGNNTLKYYAYDISANYTSRTNISNFIYDTTSPTSEAPVIAALSNLTVNPGQMISFLVTATAPGGSPLSFNLSQAPAGSKLDSVSGLFTWRPSLAQANSTNLVGLSVTGGQATSLTNFTVVVRPITAPTLTLLSSAGSQLRFQISGPLGPDYTVQASSELSSWSNLLTTTPSALPFNFVDTNAAGFTSRFYRVKLAP